MTEDLNKNGSQGGDANSQEGKGGDFDPKTEVEKLKKELSDAQKKIGSMGEQYEQLNDFVQGSSIVINTVAGDPDLAKRFQDTLKKQYGASDAGGAANQQQKQDQNKDNLSGGAQSASAKPDPVVDDVASYNRDRVFQDFEDRHGIISMDREERKKTWQDVEVFFREFGQSVKTMPLSSLERNLERAYLAIKANKLREEGKLEGFVEARNNAYGMMPSMSSGSLNEEESKGKLSQKQSDIAKRMGIDIEKVKKVWANRDNEGERIPPAEKASKKN